MWFPRRLNQIKASDVFPQTLGPMHLDALPLCGCLRLAPFADELSRTPNTLPLEGINVNYEPWMAAQFQQNAPTEATYGKKDYPDLPGNRRNHFCSTTVSRTSGWALLAIPQGTRCSFARLQILRFENKKLSDMHPSVVLPFPFHFHL